MNTSVKTSNKQQVVDITEQVQSAVSELVDGALLIFVKHTTCAITTADLDPGTDQDFLDFLNSLVPKLDWRHPHDPQHTPAHLLSSLIGPALVVPVKNGKLQLGTWQRVVLIEVDGPRNRELVLQTLRDN